MCKMKGERHLYIGGVPRDLSTKGVKKLNKKNKIKNKKSYTTHDLVNKSKLNDLAKSFEISQDISSHYFHLTLQQVIPCCVRQAVKGLYLQPQSVWVILILWFECMEFKIGFKNDGSL